ncbi:MAG: hypothetical protein WCH74_01135 [Chloroflexota bacterium]
MAQGDAGDLLRAHERGDFRVQHRVGPDPGPQGSVVGIVGAAFLVLTHLNARSAVLAPAFVQAFLQLTIFWSLRRPDVEAFFTP